MAKQSVEIRRGTSKKDADGFRSKINKIAFLTGEKRKI